MTKNEYKIQEILGVPLPPMDQIPGITVPKINYGVSVGGKDAPADGATRNLGALADLNSVDTAQIVAGAVTKVKMALLSVDADIIAANAITESKLYTGAVTADKIAANCITAAKIASRTITASEIAVGSITAYEMNVSSLSAITANVGTLTSGTITGVLIQTSSSSNVGVKMSTSSLTLYDNSFELRDSAGTLYGYIGGYGGYYRMETYSSRNMLLGASGGSVILYSDTVPLYTNSANLGNSSFRWGNVYTSNLDINGGSYYINYNSSKSAINSNSNFRVAGSVYITGNLIFENGASITINGRSYYETTGAYDASKYYLRS